MIFKPKAVHLNQQKPQLAQELPYISSKSSDTAVFVAASGAIAIAQKTIGDGACFYRAVAKSLSLNEQIHFLEEYNSMIRAGKFCVSTIAAQYSPYELTDEAKIAYTLRQLAVDKINADCSRTNADGSLIDDAQIKRMVLMATEEVATYSGAIRRMRHARKWADETEVVALGEVLARDFVIITDDADDSAHVIRREFNNPEGCSSKPVCLRFLGAHYENIITAESEKIEALVTADKLSKARPIDFDSSELESSRDDDKFFKSGTGQLFNSKKTWFQLMLSFMTLVFNSFLNLFKRTYVSTSSNSNQSSDELLDTTNSDDLKGDTESVFVDSEPSLQDSDDDISVDSEVEAQLRAAMQATEEPKLVAAVKTVEGRLNPAARAQSHADDEQSSSVPSRKAVVCGA